MAGLRGVKILLLWAGIIGLAKCQEANKSTNVTAQVSDQPTNATTASATTNHTKGPSPLTSPEVNPSNTTVNNTIPGQKDDKPPEVTTNATTASATTNHTKGPSPLTSPEVNPSNTTVNNTIPGQKDDKPPEVTTNATTASATTNDTKGPSPLTSPEVNPSNTTVNNTTPGQKDDKPPEVTTNATTASATTNHTKGPSPLTSPEVNPSNTTPAKATTASATTNHTKGPSPLTSPEVNPSNTTRVRRSTIKGPESNATTASATTNHTKDSSSLTSPEVNPSNTTVNNTTPAPNTTAPPLTCNYTVKPIKFGLQIDITSSAVNPVPTSITINEKGENHTEAIFTASHSNRSSSHEIKQLKPCTKYELNVTLDDKDKPTPCQPMTVNDNMTDPIMKEDIEEANCSSTSSKSVCYRTGWNISSLQTTPVMIPDLQCGNNTVCFKPGSDDICSNMTFTFSLKTCTSTSFQLDRNITRDFFDVKSINQTAPTQFPVEFKTKLPPNCNLSIDYTCREFYRFNEANLANLSELEPFTDYSCTGHIKDKNGTEYNTAEVDVRIDCDLEIKNLTSYSTTNTSSQLNWTTTSNGCKDVLKKLSYICSCNYPYKSQLIFNQPQRGTCNITTLKPYTDYTCKVQPYYNGRNVRKEVSVDLKTKIGVPDDASGLILVVKDHNTISMECRPGKSSNGPWRKFRAQVVYGSSIVETNLTNCKFEFKDLKYLTTYTVKVTAFNSLYESHTITEQISTEYNDKAVIGFLIFLIILTSVALLLVVYKIWDMRRRKSHDLSENLILISTANDEENLLPVEPIAAELLLEAYKRKLADEARLFLAEFQSIPRIFSRHSVKEAKKSSNVPKNRYVDILPYDYNRVQLTTGNGEAGCDYINASFIDGYKEAKKYIAAQGPKDETLGDFWRMVWEQQSSIIVMVTRCEEGNRVKCSQYWPAPDREAEIFEEFVVKLNSEEICPDYTIRHLSLTNKREKSSDREVTHIQFMSWPDHGVPSEPHLLLKLRRRVNAFKNFFSGPIIVHCSAGVGRTGTYIGIDAMMEAMEVEGRVDIYGYMVRLRRQRCLMVQVEAQYILIHQALVEHNQFGETEIPLSEVHSTLSQLTEKTSESEPTLMEEEFDRVPTFHKWRTVNVGISEENKGKNRPSSVIPYDYNRVLLKLNEGRSHDSDPEDEEEESSDEEDEDSCRYINASHINGYWGPRALIAAQTPLPDTMADFWLMVYQKKVSTLVMLSEENKESEAVYWDKDKRTFGDLEVEVVSTDATPTFIRRNLMIRHVKKTESRSVNQFQFLKWVNRELPETPQCLADMMKEIKKGGGGSKSQTTLVHCNDGSSRSGVFCALWNLLDCAHTEKVMDVFQVVKTLRKERQNMISSLAQYQFLYDTVQMVFPVQNGEVKAVQASAADSIQIISETAAAEQADSAASSQQQEAAESTHLVAEEDKEEEPGKESPLMEDTSTVPLDV